LKSVKSKDKELARKFQGPNTMTNKYIIAGGSRAPFSQLGEDCFADVNPKGR
jgi:hypothetical protein